MKDHQDKFTKFLQTYHKDHKQNLEAVKEIALNAIADSKLPEKLTRTTNMSPESSAAVKNVVSVIT